MVTLVFLMVAFAVGCVYESHNPGFAKTQINKVKQFFGKKNND